MSFGRPKSADTRRPRSAPWSAHTIDRNFSNFNDILKNSTMYEIGRDTPYQRPKSARAGYIEPLYPKLDALDVDLDQDPETEESTSIMTPPAPAMTKSAPSYHLNQHVTTYVDCLESRTGYRVLAYRLDLTGKFIMLHDILDNTMYHCGTVVNTSFAKTAAFVPLFDSKESALSEKFPHSNPKTRHGKYARVLASFDAWGACQRRYGGPQAVIFEHAKFMNIVEVLDQTPQTPRSGTPRRRGSRGIGPGRPRPKPSMLNDEIANLQETLKSIKKENNGLSINGKGIK